MGGCSWGPDHTHMVCDEQKGPMYNSVKKDRSRTSIDDRPTSPPETVRGTITEREWEYSPIAETLWRQGGPGRKSRVPRGENTRRQHRGREGM